MTDKISLAAANTMIATALEKGAELDLKPLSVIVLDAGGHVIAFQRQDGASNLRFKIAHGKAYGAISMGIGSRALFQRAQEQAFFISAVNALADGALVPVPGGVLVKTQDGALVGAVGITGDTSENDETCAITAIEQQGFVAVP